MALCHRCGRPLPPNQRCVYCGSPEFEKLEGETKRRGKRDALSIWLKRVLWLALIGAAAWFLAFTARGQALVALFRDFIGK